MDKQGQKGFRSTSASHKAIRDSTSCTEAVTHPSKCTLNVHYNNNYGCVICIHEIPWDSQQYFINRTAALRSACAVTCNCTKMAN